MIPALRSGLVNAWRPTGSEGQALLGAALYRGTPQTADGSTTLVDVAATGELAQLPARALAAALGGEARRERLACEWDPAVLSGDSPIGSALTPVSGRRDVRAPFAELTVPIASGFEAQLALRRDDDSGVGSTTIPKLALRWLPAARLLLRGSLGRGLRAPPLYSLNEPQDRCDTYAGRDPLRCAATGGVDDCFMVVPMTAGGNPAALRARRGGLKMHAKGVRASRRRRKETTMRRFVSRLPGSILLATALAAGAAEIDVMTQNQYLGADLTPVIAATTPEAFNAAVVATLARIAASRPAERVQALAAQVRQRRPDVVGLQEAWRFGCLPYPGVPNLPGTGCDDPLIRDAFTDQLQGTEAALHGQYRVAGRVTNMRIDQLPFVVSGVPAILQVADRDAILVRDGLDAVAVDLPALTGCQASDDGCRYAAVAVIPTPLGVPIPGWRGFLAVDLAARGQRYRVFNTHLEVRQLAPQPPELRLLQVAQAGELVQAALVSMQQDPARRLVVVGDFNAAPEDQIPGVPTPYQLLTGHGFADAWLLHERAGAGLTCCQAEDLSNRRSAHYERIDHVFALPTPRRVPDMRVLGTTPGDRTRPAGDGGLWASDHAAVSARLQYD